jgi:hypothetical protein
MARQRHVTWNITRAVKTPVMADVDTGGGNAVSAAWISERLIAMGDRRKVRCIAAHSQRGCLPGSRSPLRSA